eukprot:9913-Eustigmatos_ZCMA.PRE.1
MAARRHGAAMQPPTRGLPRCFHMQQGQLHNRPACRIRYRVRLAAQTGTNPRQEPPREGGELPRQCA